MSECSYAAGWSHGSSLRTVQFELIATETEQGMERKTVSMKDQRAEVSKTGRRFGIIRFALAMCLGIGTLTAAQSKVQVIPMGGIGSAERMASNELVAYLSLLYPGTRFEVGSPGTQAGTGPVVYVGTSQDLPEKYLAEMKGRISSPESYAVKIFGGQGAPVAVIAGANAGATVFAVDALLEKLGFGFYLSYSTAPAVSQAAFSFAGWELEDAPIAGERVIFNWHNFLSGCSTWNLSEWKEWITQAQRMRFNTMMVHAYGNNPMYSFTMNGQTKPTGYLANSQKGRDWGTQHVVEVRKMVAADGYFTGPVFGADASLVEDNQTVAAATELMRKVFQFAAGKGMGVTFALDVDTEQANPQNVIRTLPASARFEVNRFQFVDPDTPEGYAYYRTEIDQLIKLYPEITQLAVWFRGGLNSKWRELQPSDFPPAWHEEWHKAMEANPQLKNDPEAPSMFAIGKIARAFRKALDETGHNSVTMTAGSWRFTYLPSADAFMPSGVGLMPLDYDYAFGSDPVQESLRVIGRHRPVIPIVWAQHDDREYAGRSYTPFAGLGSMLRWTNSAGYGVIHWTTRPLDLFFKNVADQVWTASENETLDVTTAAMAKRTFGAKNEELGKRYLLNWIYDGPAFGEETTDKLVNRNHFFDAENETVGANKRMALLKQMRPLAADAKALDWVGYFEDWEHYAQGVYEAQSALQRSETALAAGDAAAARSAIAEARPESAIEAYARAIKHGATSQGEKGILITLNLRWLPYFEAQRQAVGLEPLQVEFAPTVHEPLAQGVGHYSFDFDAAKHVVEVLGTDELGVEVRAFTGDANCSSGVDVTSAVKLAVGGLGDTKLQPGVYRMKLKMPVGAQVQVEVGDKSQAVTPATELEVQASEGKVRFTLSPVAGSVRICGLTLERPE